MTPAAQLVQLLAHARRTGVTFPEAWPAAAARALAGAEPDEQGEWLEALESTRDAWEAAWQRRPSSRPERALYAVAADPEREPLPDRTCGRCGQAIPPERDRRAASDGRRIPAQAA